MQDFKKSFWGISSLFLLFLSISLGFILCKDVFLLEKIIIMWLNYHGKKMLLTKQKKLVLKFGENELLVTKRNREKNHISIIHVNYSNYIFHEIIALWYAQTKVNKLTKLQNSCSIKTMGNQGSKHSSLILSSSTSPFKGKHTKN